jgi:hypothetical protein
VRGASVARVVTAGPLLGASAFAVASAVVGGLLRRVAVAGRPARPEPVHPAGGTQVRVTWAVVEIRWTAR